MKQRQQLSPVGDRNFQNSRIKRKLFIHTAGSRVTEDNWISDKAGDNVILYQLA